GTTARLENHAVIEGRGARTGDAGSDALAAAAVAGDQVIHDLAGEHYAVRLHDLAINFDTVACASSSHRHQVRLISADVVEIANPAVDFVADDGAALIFRLRAVNAQRENDKDVRIGNPR